MSEVRAAPDYPPNACARGCWRPAVEMEPILPGANAPQAAVCRVGDCLPVDWCPVCRRRPKAARKTKTGKAPTTCGHACTVRAAECRRQGIPLHTPPLKGEAMREARRRAGRKRLGGKRYTLPDGMSAWGTPEAFAAAAGALERAGIGTACPAEGLAIAPPESRAAAIKLALESWFTRGYLRGRAERNRREGSRKP